MGHVIRRDTDSQIREVVELEIEGKRKKVRPRKSWKSWVIEEIEDVRKRSGAM